MLHIRKCSVDISSSVCFAIGFAMYFALQKYFALQSKGVIHVLGVIHFLCCDSKNG